MFMLFRGKRYTMAKFIILGLKLKYFNVFYYMF